MAPSPKVEAVRRRIDDVLKYPHLFIEHFLWIKDKDGNIQPFYLNDIQKKYYAQLMRDYWKPYKNTYRLQGVREVNLKARQFGLSTFISALLFFDTVTYSGTDTRIYCQDKKYSKEMLLKYKLFYDMLPADARPSKKDFSAEKISFDKLHSSLFVGTPGVNMQVARKQGRSTTFRNLHASEFAEWPRPKVALNAMMDAIPSGNGIVILESSPNMINDHFHLMYNQGKSKQQRKKRSVWRSRFWPWFEHREYARAVDQRERSYLLKSLTLREKWLVQKFGVTLEQLAWRRDKISEKGGDVQLFTKEYPENDYDCFAAESELVFPQGIQKLKCVERPAIQGHVHTIGVDVSAGIVGKDEYGIVVVDADVGEQIFAEHGYMDPVALAHRVYEVWLMYPGLVGIEINNHGLATVKEATTHPYLNEWRTPEPGFLYSNNRRGGFETTHANKGPTLFRLRTAIRMGLQEMENMGRSMGMLGLKLSSEDILRQMSWYQFLPDGKGFGAPENSYDENGKKLCDDLIIALMIAYNLLEELPWIEDQWNEKFAGGRMLLDPADELIIVGGDIDEWDD